MAPTIPTTAADIIRIATGEIGTQENPPRSNRNKYGKAMDMDGVKWCAIFIAWVFRTAGYDLRNISRNYFYTPLFFRELKEAGWDIVKTKDARAGDIAFFDFNDNVKRIQHVGLVYANEPAHLLLTTIDGNTSVTSDDNGGEVMKRSRTYDAVKAVIRPPYGSPVYRYRLTRTLRVRRPIMMRGNDVRKVQRLVKAPVDGVYGPVTAAKVGSWQRKVGIAVDGQFGPKSARAAGWYYGKY